MMRKTVLAACLGLLSACAALPEKDGGKSVVEELRKDDAACLAETMAKITRLRLDEDRDRPVYVARPDQDAVFTPAFLGHLRNAGYTVVDVPSERARRLRYQIGSYGDAMLMRVRLDDEEMTATFRRRADGTLALEYPYSVRSAGE